MLRDTDGFYYGEGNSPSESCSYIDTNNNTKNALEGFKKELLLVGRFEYKNYLTKKIRYYDFVVMYYYLIGGYNAKLLENRNYDLP
jgi:hypothetical protein